MWLILLFVLAVYVLLKAVYMRWRYDVHKVPSPPRLPIIGHGLSFKKALATAPISAIFRNWREELGNCKMMKAKNIFCPDFWRPAICVDRLICLG